MYELIRSALFYAVMLIAIILGFRLFKNSDRVTVDANDSSMNMRAGDYRVDTAINGVKDLGVGQKVSYFVEELDKFRERVAWVVAVEGDTVEIANKKVVVNGKESKFSTNNNNIKVREVRVPRGCVYLLAENSDLTMDSTSLGPVPFYVVRGRLQE